MSRVGSWTGMAARLIIAFGKEHNVRVGFFEAGHGPLLCGLTSGAA